MEGSSTAVIQLKSIALISALFAAAGIYTAVRLGGVLVMRRIAPHLLPERAQIKEPRMVRDVGILALDAAAVLAIVLLIFVIFWNGATPKGTITLGFTAIFQAAIAFTAYSRVHGTLSNR